MGWWLGVAASVLTIWKTAMPLITFPSPLMEALAYAILVGVLAYSGWNLCVGVWRGVLAACWWLYNHTKRGRFVALRNQVETMMIALPSRGNLYNNFGLPDQHKLVALIVELNYLGITPPPDVPQDASYEEVLQYYEAVINYLGQVHVFILQNNLKGCIEMMRTYWREGVLLRRAEVCYPCPIPGCQTAFFNTHSGWDGHVGTLRTHPQWHPDLTDPEARKVQFKAEFPDWL